MPPTILHGDCLALLPSLAENSIDAIVTDPPYNLTSIAKRFSKADAKPAGLGGNGQFGRLQRGFMGKAWDTDIAFRPDVWEQCLRVLKPGGHLAVFGGSRTHHRVWVAVEDAGFEIRDTLMWVYSQGFPKSLNVGKVAPQWQGYGTALKPSHEPILLARKPLEGTVAANVLKHGTGALNIDATRVPTSDKLGGGMLVHGRPTLTREHNIGWDRPWMHDAAHVAVMRQRMLDKTVHAEQRGRWPSNLLLDGSDDVTDCFPRSRSCSSPSAACPEGSILGGRRSQGAIYPGEDGSAARFFPSLGFSDDERILYCSKATRKDRAGSKHPTIKPVRLIEWLCRLICPPGGTILDPFAGSGTTGQAALNLGFEVILIEREADYYRDILARFAPDPLLVVP